MLIRKTVLCLFATIVIAAPAQAAVFTTDMNTGSGRYGEAVDGGRFTIPESAGSQASSALSGVSADSASDAWAVGWRMASLTASRQTLAMHWNGASWARVPTPNVGHAQCELLAVAAISPSDAWTVGYHLSRTGKARALIFHWDGTAWGRVPSPSDAPYESFLNGVSAASANDIYAVGKNLIIHWDGSTWSMARRIRGGFLQAVSARPSGASWAVGETLPTATESFQPLAFHGSGLAWSRAPMPSADPTLQLTKGVATVGRSQVWAVGYGCLTGPPPGCSGRRAISEQRRDGHWRIVPITTDPPGVTSWLNAVSAASKDDVWAVGAANGGFDTLAVRWNGTSWEQVATPKLEGNPELLSVSAYSDTDAWAVGYHYDVSTSIPVILHWNGTAWLLVSDA